MISTSKPPLRLLNAAKIIADKSRKKEFVMPSETSLEVESLGWVGRGDLIAAGGMGCMAKMQLLWGDTGVIMKTELMVGLIINCLLIWTLEWSSLGIDLTFYVNHQANRAVREDRFTLSPARDLRGTISPLIGWFIFLSPNPCPTVQSFPMQQVDSLEFCPLFWINKKKKSTFPFLALLH